MIFALGFLGISPDAIVVSPYLQNATPTSIVVAWETKGDSTECIVEYGTTETLGLSESGISQTTVEGHLVHHVKLNNLPADTRVWYRVRTGDAAHGVHVFRTPAVASDEGRQRFVAYSDMQLDDANPLKHQEMVDEGIVPWSTQHAGSELDAALDFILIPGDLVSTGGNHTHWTRDFFGQAAKLFHSVPFYATPGNHEQNHPLYFQYVDVPDNGTPKFEEHWYWTDQGNCRVIGLDTNDGYRVEDQLTWLDGVLQSAAKAEHIDFVFAQFHHPHRSESWTPGETTFSSEVVEKMVHFSRDTGKPSVHFFGHTHSYSRGQHRDHMHGMVNVASGMGNPDYWWEYPQADYEEFEISTPDWGFCHVETTAGDNPTMTLRRLSRGNEFVKKDNEETDLFILKRFPVAPKAPKGLSPNHGSGSVPTSGAVFQGSPFEDPDARDGRNFAHESQWQVASGSRTEDFQKPIQEAWRRYRNLWRSPDKEATWYSVDTVKDADVTRTTFDDALPANQHLFWRVRYRDENLAWSKWSKPMPFTTENASGAPEQTNASLDPIFTQWGASL